MIVKFEANPQAPPSFLSSVIPRLPMTFSILGLSAVSIDYSETASNTLDNKLACNVETDNIWNILAIKQPFATVMMCTITSQ